MRRAKLITGIVLGLVATAAIILVMVYGLGAEARDDGSQTTASDSHATITGTNQRHVSGAEPTLPVRKIWLGQWPSSPRYALTFGDGRTARLEKGAEQNEQNRDDPQPLLKQIGDFAWRQRGAPQIIVGSGRAAVLGGDLDQLADQDLSSQLVDTPYFEGETVKPSHVYLIQTVQGHYAMVYLAAIGSLSTGQEQAWVAWVYQPDGTARFPLAAVRALFEQGKAMSATAGAVPAAVLMSGTAVLHSQGTERANVLDLTVGGTKPPPLNRPDPSVMKRAMHDPDSPDYQAIKAYNAAMAASADLFYDQYGERLVAASGRITPLVNLDSATLEALDDRYLFDTRDSEKTSDLKPRAIFLYQTKPGQDLAFQTRDGRWVIARVLSRADGSLSLAWAMQPDKSSRFPGVADLLPEPDVRQEPEPPTKLLYNLVQDTNMPAEKLAAKVKALVETGVDIDAQVEPVGDTALHMAALYGSPSAVKALLKVGAHVNVRSRGGATPLHYAAAFGRLDTAKILLEHGADPLAQTSEGRTVIQEAMGARPIHDDLVALLKDHAQTNESKMPLHTAAEVSPVPNKSPE